MLEIRIIGSIIGLLFHVAIIFVLVSLIRKKVNPGMPRGGYCLARTRERLICLAWAVLLIFFAVCLGVYCFVLLTEDKDGWDYMNYIYLVIGLLGMAVCTVSGIYEGYTAIRDSLFPEKSRLAASIRSQLPHPDLAPSIQELFSIVDQDIEENGEWFGKVAVGKEWVLGDEASYIPHIRAVFGRDEIQTHHTGRGAQLRRIVQIYIVDNRKQVQVTSLQNSRKLNLLLSCLRLRAPLAYFGNYSEYPGYCHKTDAEWAAMERSFQRRLSQMKYEEEERRRAGR